MKQIPIVLVGALAAMIIASYSHGQATNSVTPPPRYSFALAYDEARGKLVMFGGFRGRVFNDTWEWDGDQWEMKSESGPSPRNGPAMVYDSKRKKIILFGGDAMNQTIADTWEWDGSQWKKLASDGPPGRSLHSMAYDSKRDRVVLFGGIANEKLLGDLWEWNGTAWQQMPTRKGPDARFLHGAAYDPLHGKVLIFGGDTLFPPALESVRGDLWAWDGKSWENLKKKGPSARDHVDMAYDFSRKKVVLHGGGVPEGISATDTWAWDGKSWAVLSNTTEAPTEGYKLAYDFRNQCVILMGGFAGGGPSSSLWNLGEKGWKLVK